MRVTEGLLREKFNLDKQAWKEAFHKYGTLKLQNFDDLKSAGGRRSFGSFDNS